MRHLAVGARRQCDDLLDGAAIDALTGEQFGREPVGVVEQRQQQMVRSDLDVAGLLRLVLGGDHDIARARGEPPEAGVGVEGGDSKSGTLGTNRFWAACLVTPMHLPMSVHEAPERRAWSTKWPIR